MKKVLLGIFVISLIAVSCSKDSPGGGGGGTTPPTTAKTPGKAVLTAPANNKTCEEVNTAGQVTFTWNASTDTDKYDLKITNLNTQSVTNHNNITTTSKAATLSKGIPYSWNITSKNEGTKTTTSDTWQFYLAGDGVVNYAPFPATASSPTPGATVAPTDGKITLGWSGSDTDDDNLTYTIEMDTVDGIQETVMAADISESSLEVSVEADRVYYWRVITSDGQNTSTSIVFSFRTTT
jgi:methionine-rich copper-binding protein CopC